MALKSSKDESSSGSSRIEGRSGHSNTKGEMSSEYSSRSEASSNTEKSISPGNTLPPQPPRVQLAPPPLPKKRPVRELLETRKTPSKMEIGHGVLLKADIMGAELVIIRGNFDGNLKAQCVDIEQGAEVTGTIECEAARINGKFDGLFVSVHSLHLASRANVSGRIIYRRLKIAKGAQVFGYTEYRSPVVPKNVPKKLA